jgi:hypothetical protein
MNKHCPSDEFFRNVAEEGAAMISGPEIDRAMTHIRGCRSCSEKVQRLARTGKNRLAEAA